MTVPASVAVIQFPLGVRPGQSNLFLDPAEQVLLQTEEAKKRRKREETRIELEKIQDRIGYTLNEYEGVEKMEKIASATSVNFELIDDPVELYELLADTRMRSKYQHNLTVFIVGLEEKCEDRERLLQSLQEFFLEAQAGNTQQLLEEVASEEIDFSEATLGLEGALETAQNAAQRLLEIKREMGQLFAIVATYPDTKKGRKKLEKALLKAQEEVQSLTSTLQDVQSELEQSKEKCSALQRSVEAKGAECAKLRKAAEQVKKLEVTNDSLKAELASVQLSLKKAQEELEKAVSAPAKVEPVVKEVVKVDEERVRELEAQLAQERTACQKLIAEKEEEGERHRSELDALRAEHDGEVEEMRSRYEEQLKSLMEDDDVFGETASHDL